ncbi:hypothetical protein HanPI659440_Chr12g0456401 [Helianthus annuus]|nr:hypothetical protein HanPI659440_Chr12g0456401 [Helianthus annuus]
MDPAGSDISQALALSRNENGNNLNRTTSSETSLMLNVEHTLRKAAMCHPGSSCSRPSNCTEFCTILIMLDLISKVGASIVGLIILGSKPVPPS